MDKTQRDVNGVTDQTSVTVTLQSTSDQSGQAETTGFKTSGTLYQKEAATYLRYDEMINEVDKVNTTIKITDEEATIIRRGAVSMRQRFKPGVQVDGTYESKYGPIKIATDTKSMDFNWDDRNRTGSLSLEYRIFFQHEVAGNHRLSISLKGERT